MSTLQSAVKYKALSVLSFQVIKFDMDPGPSHVTPPLALIMTLYTLYAHISSLMSGNVSDIAPRCQSHEYQRRSLVDLSFLMVLQWPWPLPSLRSLSHTLMHVGDAERVVSRLSPAYLTANRSKAVSVTRRRNLKVSIGITDGLPSSPWTYGEERERVRGREREGTNEVRESRRVISHAVSLLGRLW